MLIELNFKYIRLDPIKLYTRITGKTGGLFEDGIEYKLEEFKFHLDLYDSKDYEVIANSHRLSRLKNIKELVIYHVKSADDENVKNFLGKVAPQQLENITFGGGNRDDLLKAEYYLKEINTVMKNTTRYVHLSSCIFSPPELQSIFASAKHLTQLKFYYCELGVDDGFEINEQDFNIEYLVLLG